MADSFATVVDIQDRWRPLSPTETTRATVLLKDATVYIASLCEENEISLDPLSEDLTEKLRIVTSEVVIRRMKVPMDQAAVTQFSQTTGPFSTQQTYSNPEGGFYLTKAERQLLGVKKARQRIGSIQPAIGVSDDS